MATKTQTKTTTPEPSNVRNGMRRPRDGSITGTMWASFDSGEVTADTLKAQAEAAGWNLGLTRSHFRQWKKFNAKPAQATGNGAAKPAAKKAAPIKKAAVRPVEGDAR